MKYTLIIRTMSGEYIKTLHFKTQKEAVENLLYYQRYAHVVTFMNYAIYLDNPKKWECKNYALIREEVE